MQKKTGRENGIINGVLWKELILFFFPVLLGALAQQSYSVVDAIIVGRFAGKNALGAIDATGNILRLFINFFIGLSSGATVIISQYYGAGKKDKVSEAVHTIIAFSVIGGILMTGIGIFLAPASLKAISIPADIAKDALLYARIYFAGTLGVLLYNTGAGILRAVGDSRRPSIYLMISCTLNVILDLLMVGVFKMGVMGAGLSTILSQAVSAIMVLKALMNTEGACRYRIRNTTLVIPVLKKMLAIGLPIGFQASIHSLSNLFMQSSINFFGTNVIAAWAICGKMDLIIWIIIESLGIAVTTFVAQNYGAKKPERMKKSIRDGIVIALILVGSISLMLYLYAKPIAGLFVKDEQVIRITADIMRMIAPFYVTYIWFEILGGGIRGVGQAFKAMLLATIGTCGLKISWILLVVPHRNELMVVLAGYPFTWIVTSAMFIIYYLKTSRGWKEI